MGKIFKPMQQSRRDVLGAYCPNTYIHCNHRSHYIRNYKQTKFISLVDSATLYCNNIYIGKKCHFFTALQCH